VTLRIQLSPVQMALLNEHEIGECPDLLLKRWGKRMSGTSSLINNELCSPGFSLQAEIIDSFAKTCEVYDIIAFCHANRQDELTKLVGDQDTF
jgi:hypothetical protein